MEERRGESGLIECFVTKRRLLTALLLGQCLSVLLCGTGTTSQLLEAWYHISVPTTQVFVVYVLLAAIFGPVLATRKDFLCIIRKNWWKYIILGFLDVEGNYLVVLAYKFTTLTSIQLLDSFAIVAVMALSFAFLHIRYHLIHVVGVTLAILGMVVVFLADLHALEADGGNNRWLGDLLCIAGVTFYAIGNVAQEFLVKNHSVVEYLSMIGLVGSVITGIQMCVLDRVQLVSANWSNSYIGLLLSGFGACLLLFYVITPQVMRLSSAVVFNLSLITSDFLTLIVGILFFRFTFSYLYIIGMLLTVVGVAVYSSKPPTAAGPGGSCTYLISRLCLKYTPRSGISRLKSFRTYLNGAIYYRSPSIGNDQLSDTTYCRSGTHFK